MKANAPERIYIGIIPGILGGHIYTTVNKDFPNAVEYTHIDAFIEKACTWLRNYVNPIAGTYLIGEDIEKFKNYMEEE